MSCTWNGRPGGCERNEDSPAARCLAILERGMHRLGMSPAPARMNRILSAPATGTPEAAQLKSLRERKRALVAEWRTLPEAARVLSVLSRKHQLSYWPARHALEEADVLVPKARKGVA